MNQWLAMQHAVAVCCGYMLWLYAVQGAPQPRALDEFWLCVPWNWVCDAGLAMLGFVVCMALSCCEQQQQGQSHSTTAYTKHLAFTSGLHNPCCCLCADCSCHPEAGTVCEQVRPSSAAGACCHTICILCAVWPPAATFRWLIYLHCSAYSTCGD
jgi:hypothetical protein